MAPNTLPTLSIAVVGTGSPVNLGPVTGQSIRVWQMVITGTVSDTVTLVWTVANVQTSMKINVLANSTVVFPMTGTPWATADTGTAISITAASTTTITSYYTKGIGG